MDQPRSGGPEPLTPYPELLGRLDAWASEARAAHPGVIPCAPGCSACCHGPFDISAADATALREAVRALPDADRQAISHAARRLAARMDAFAPEWEAPWDPAALGDDRFDALCEALADAPCPVPADDGRCLAYAGRPLVCRLMGLGLETPDGRVLENTCPIQDRFPDYADLPPRPFDLDAWEAEEARCLAALGPDARETTIAHALRDLA